MSSSHQLQRGRFVEVVDGDTHFDAYWSPATWPTGKSVVLLHEIFGVTEKMRRYADDLAQEGFDVLVPDLFWRMARRVELGHDPEGMAKAMELLHRFSDARALDDIRSSVSWLRRQGSNVALMGFCLGGKLVVLGRTYDLADAYVAYYGVGIEKIAEPLDRNDVPLLMHYGSDDSYAPLASVRKFASRLGRHAQISIYDGVGHAFYAPGRNEASALSRERTVAFLKTQLDMEGWA